MATADPQEPFAPAPRHMRSRHLRRDTPSPAALRTPVPQAVPTPRIRRKTSHRSKRIVALILVILVAVSIPLLAMALIFIP
ncbi:hypothetical protein AAIH32_08715 [Pseudarthrobacter oxydans]|uniref:hypothetical protein n=1 Tax=Pseudarthrobacter oxydans TaxID=1671 RepID=UPI003D2A6A1B